MPGASSSTTVGVSGSAGPAVRKLPCRRHDCLHLPRISQADLPGGPALLGHHRNDCSRLHPCPLRLERRTAVSARHTVDQTPPGGLSTTCWPRLAAAAQPGDGHAPDFVDDGCRWSASCARTPCCTPAPRSTWRVSADEDAGHRGRHRPRPRARSSWTWPSRAGATGGPPPTAAVCPCIARLATTWGTRHEADGHHTVWFSLARRPGTAAEPAAAPAPEHERTWAAAEEARWLLHVPASLARRLDPVDLVRELAARLRDMADAAAVVVEVDRRRRLRDPRVRSRRCSPRRHRRRARERPRRAAADHDRPARHHPARPARGRRRRARPGADRADRRADRHHRRVAVAPRGGPAPPGVDDLSGRGQRAPRPVPRPRPDGRARAAAGGAAAGHLVRGAAAAAVATAAPGRDRARRRGPAAGAARGARPRRRAGSPAAAARPARGGHTGVPHRPGSPTPGMVSRSRCGPAGPRPGCCWWGAPQAARTPPRTCC